MSDPGTGARPPRAGLVISTSLSGTAESARQARDLMTRACRVWGLDAIAFDAEIVASELVENAIRHGGGPGTVRVVLDGAGLTVTVADRTPAPPLLAHPEVDQQGGRGLLLVDRLSEQWGHRRTAAGKEVWARLRLPGAVPPGEERDERE